MTGKRKKYWMQHWWLFPICTLVIISTLWLVRFRPVTLEQLRQNYIGNQARYQSFVDALQTAFAESGFREDLIVQIEISHSGKEESIQYGRLYYYVNDSNETSNESEREKERAELRQICERFSLDAERLFTESSIAEVFITAKGPDVDSVQFVLQSEWGYEAVIANQRRKPNGSYSGNTTTEEAAPNWWLYVDHD